jgi:hypothetical protein
MLGGGGACPSHKPKVAHEVCGFFSSWLTIGSRRMKCSLPEPRQYIQTVLPPQASHYPIGCPGKASHGTGCDLYFQFVAGYDFTLGALDNITDKSV